MVTTAELLDPPGRAGSSEWAPAVLPVGRPTSPCWPCPRGGPADGAKRRSVEGCSSNQLRRLRVQATSDSLAVRRSSVGGPAWKAGLASKPSAPTLGLKLGLGLLQAVGSDVRSIPTHVRSCRVVDADPPGA